MRFGLLGTGYWAEHTQAAAIVAHDEAELVGVWGRDPAKAAALAEQHRTTAYEDLDALLADVDAVAVALPPDVQAELALRAAKAGRHLLLDKPLSFTVEAADEIVAAVEAGGLASVVFFTNRFVPAVESFIRHNAAEGGWYAAHGTMYASIFQPDSPYKTSQWRRDRGGLWDLGPHALSVIVPLLGPVVEVSAVDGPRQTTHLLLRHEGGAASTLSLTLDAAPDATAFSFAYFGEHGAATLPPWDTTSVGAFGQAISTLIAQTTGTPPPGPVAPCDVRLGRDIVAVLAAAETARANHNIVRP
jgi:predicted dehydrogenase